MFRPTQCLEARLRLTTKQVGRGYYKGNRTGSMGYFAKQKGKYIIDWKKVRTYVCPQGLEESKLTPFVTKAMEPTKDMFVKTVTRGDKDVVVPAGYHGKDFLDEWARDNRAEMSKMKNQEKVRQEVAKRKAAEKEERRKMRRQSAEGEADTI